jgi:hypothetical protein
MKLIILLFFLLLNISRLVSADTSLSISARDPDAKAEVDTIKLGGPSPYQGQSCNCLKIRAEAAAARLEKRASYGLYLLQCKYGMDASDCTATYGTSCTSTGQLINPATWGINGGPANRPQPAGKYGDCSTALGYCWCEWVPSSMCEYCFKEDGGNSSSTLSTTATQPALSSKSLPSGSTVTSLSGNSPDFSIIVESTSTQETVNGTVIVGTMTAITTITTSLVPLTTTPSTTKPTSSTLGITTTIIKGISHAAAPNLGVVAAAGLVGVVAFAGLS